MNRSLLSITLILLHHISTCCVYANSSTEILQKEHADAAYLSLDMTDPEFNGVGGAGKRIMQEDKSSWERFLSRRTPRRERGRVEVEYAAGKHPYERMLETDVDNIEQNFDHDEHNYTGRRTQRVPQMTYITDDDYVPMRLQFDTHLLDAYEETYPAHVSYLRHILLPSLGSFFATTLNIVPTKQIEVPLDGICNREVKSISGFDMTDFLEYDVTAANARSEATNINDNVNVNFEGGKPTSITYDNTDLVIIVLPVEGSEYCPSSNTPNQMKTLAFATNCQNDQFDRPTVGYTGICFGPIDPSDRTSKTHRRRLTTVAHEFTHILGMNSYDMPYYYNPTTGKPRTPRDQFNRPPEETVLCVNGERETVEKPSSDTLIQVTTANGYIGYEVVTETVRQVARNQFGCQDMIGGRLENQPTGEDDCFGSHWDHRLYNNDFMAAVYTGSTQYVTPLTLALLEDSGWYKPNYSIAENSPFGLGAGCDFIKEECIQDGEVPAWGAEFFCNSPEAIGCTPDKHLMAYCDISRWDGNLPTGYQYFDADASIGGGLSQMDFCPSYSTIFRFETKENDEVIVLDCTDPKIDDSWVELRDEVFGKDSRCIDDSDGIRPLCLKTICGETGPDAGKVILETGSGRRGRCEYTGQVLRLPSGSDIICPSFAQTCPDLVCPGLCSGRGECDFSHSPARCNCFNRDDTSPHCNETSIYEYPPTISPSPTISPEPTASPSIPRPAFAVVGRSPGCARRNNVFLELACAASVVLVFLLN